MNGFTLLIGSAVIFLIAYVVMAPGLPSNGASTRRAKHRQKLRRTALTTFRQNRLFSSDTTSLQLQAPARLSVRLRLLSSVRFPSHCGLLSAASSSAAYMTTVLWWLLCAIKARVSAKLSKPTSEKKPRFSSPSCLDYLAGCDCRLRQHRCCYFRSQPRRRHILPALHSARCRFRPARLSYRHVSFPRYVLGLIGMAAAFYIGHIFPIVLSKDMWLLIIWATSLLLPSHRFGFSCSLATT